MSDTIDTFKALKNLKKIKRQRMVPCQGTCGQKFGTPTKVVPGEKCRNCDWEAPSDGHTWKSYLAQHGYNQEG